MLATTYARLKLLLTLILLSSLLTANASLIENVFINEFHYDNDGADSNEFIELAGEAGINLSGWSLYLYNGSSGSSYKNYTFADLIIPDSNNGYGFAAVSISGIQNGSPDGIALADAEDNLVQFLSYEGSFTANSGVALGITSIDIGVLEASNSAVGHSLQLTGTGSDYVNFTWQNSSAHSFGAVNTNQIFVRPTQEVARVPEPTSMMLFSSVVIFFCLKQRRKNKII